MAKFNADSLFEAIEVTLGGVDYSVDFIPQKKLDEIMKSVDVEDVEGEATVVDRQLGIILNVDPAAFVGLDTRAKAATLRHLTKTISSQMRGDDMGNLPAAVTPTE